MRRLKVTLSLRLGWGGDDDTPESEPVERTPAIGFVVDRRWDDDDDADE